ncbi:unnamed protein product [Cuscuta epithymum]|uniref:HMA domain-containing protein n=1 Tax=Cuscuta epithymum TaxID=186058 RepID=A0AAV0EQB0_9ASTE|nr:unnamed protein product [Cuscuta epithymum]
MATTVSSFVFSGANSRFLLSHPIDSSRPLPLHRLRLQSRCAIATSYSPAPSVLYRCSRKKIIRSFKEETSVPEAAAEGEDASSSPQDIADETVSVPVSPSDALTMFFRAEGTMNDALIPQVTKALEFKYLQEIEGISDLKVQVAESMASVELTKQTVIQATGVASSLVETIQGSGFKLQTLNLSFKDGEDL